MYGHLTLICGPMFSGKTTELLKRILWARNGRNRRVQVFKPSFDTRYAMTQIVSHEGLRAEAETIGRWAGIAADTEMVFFDEVQFFTQPQFDGDLTDIIGGLLQRGIDVVAGGLDMDWQGRPFPVSSYIAGMADEIVKLKSICAVCGQQASKSYRKSRSGDQVLLGGVESYEPRCTRHWAQPDAASDLFAA